MYAESINVTKDVRHVAVGLYVLLVSFIFHNYKKNADPEYAARTQQKCIRGLVICWTWKIHSDTSHTYQGPKFCRGSKSA